MMAMNLNDERLRAVTASRPELVHTSSAHSIAASDDFYSFSEQSTSSDEATTVIRHQSPEETRQLNPPRVQRQTDAQRPSTEDSMQSTVRHIGTSDTARQFPLSRNNTQPSVVLPETEAANPETPAAKARHTSSVYEGDRTPRPTTMVAVEDQTTPVPRPVSQFEDSERHAQGTRALTISEQPYQGDAPLSSVAAAVTSENTNVATDNRYSVQSRESEADAAQQDRRRHWRGGIAQPVPTPGVDPTPELHFALDQLTRDEEIRGSGRYSTDSWAYQLGSRPETMETTTDPRVSRGSDTRPLVTNAAGERVSRFSEVSSLSENKRASLTPPRKPVPVRATPEVLESPIVPVASRIAPFHSAETSEYNTQPARNNTLSWLNAANDADGDFKKDAKYNSLPDPLRWYYMLGLIALAMFLVAALVVSSVHSKLSYGLSRYDGSGTSLYFVYKYLPQLLAAIIIVWLHVVQAAIQRILPFILIRSNVQKTRGEVLRTTPMFLSNYLLPNVAPFRHGEIGLGICNIIFWLALFTVPLASSAYTPVYFSHDGHGYWRWTAVQGICWALIPLGFLLILALIFVVFKFNFRPTGLRWDPRSIADVLVMLRRLNSTIKRRSEGPQAGKFDYRPASLGLWRSSSDPNHLTQGIGVPRDLEAAHGIPSPPPPYQTAATTSHAAPADGNLQHHSTFDSWKSGGDSGRRGWLPWFMRPSPVALWIAIALVLMIAFLVVSWVNHTVLVGFNPRVGAGPDKQLNFSSANFLWAFLPSFLGMLLYLFWLPFDNYFRALQPYADMQSRSGATAARSVLLEYPAEVPLAVTLSAIFNRHFRVAWISFVPLIAITIAVLAGGVFQAQFIVGTENTIREIASFPGFVALCVFVAFYALSFPLLMPSKTRRLPEDIKYVSSLGDFVVGGRLLNESVWRGPATKSDLVGRLMLKGLTGEKSAGDGLFRFGYYVDIEGKERIGIHRG